MHVLYFNASSGIFNSTVCSENRTDHVAQQIFIPIFVVLLNYYNPGDSNLEA